MLSEVGTDTLSKAPPVRGLEPRASSWLYSGGCSPKFLTLTCTSLRSAHVADRLMCGCRQAVEGCSVCSATRGVMAPTLVDAPKAAPAQQRAHLDLLLVQSAQAPQAVVLQQVALHLRVRRGPARRHRWRPQHGRPLTLHNQQGASMQSQRWVFGEVL